MFDPKEINGYTGKKKSFQISDGIKVGILVLFISAGTNDLLKCE